jgi:hypothetical protein
MHHGYAPLAVPSCHHVSFSVTLPRPLHPALPIAHALRPLRRCVHAPCACVQSMLIMRLGVVKPLETRKFIVASRLYLGSTEAEVVEMWKTVMVSAVTCHAMLTHGQL